MSFEVWKFLEWLVLTVELFKLISSTIWLYEHTVASVICFLGGVSSANFPGPNSHLHHQVPHNGAHQAWAEDPMWQGVAWDIPWPTKHTVASSSATVTKCSTLGHNWCLLTFVSCVNNLVLDGWKCISILCEVRLGVLILASIHMNRKHCRGCKCRCCNRWIPSLQGTVRWIWHMFWNILSFYVFQRIISTVHVGSSICAVTDCYPYSFQI
jgi:hypothetical protein